MDNIRIGKTIRQLRVNKGLSQKDVANICNITAPAVSKWERGESIPDISSLECLSHLFGVSINEIINSKAEIKILANKKEILYKIIIGILSVILIVFVVIGISYLGEFRDYLRLNNVTENVDSNDPISTEFIDQSNMPYHLYYEATEHQFVQGNISDWITDVFIQEPDLYNYFNSDESPNLNFISVNTTDFIRRNNETSTIELVWQRNDDELVWEIDVTFYDIKNDDDYENLNTMHYIASNGNEYRFDVFDDGYLVLYELINGNTIFDNYYFHLIDMEPTIIEDNIQIDYELSNLGIDIIFTDQYQVTRYHYVLPDYDSSQSSWYIQHNKDMYLSFQEDNNELQFLDFTDIEGFKKIVFKGFVSEEMVWDYEIGIYDYLEHEINIDLLMYTIKYQMQNDGLLHIIFEQKIAGHIMSYKILPNELN